MVQRCAHCGTARRKDLQVCVRCETPFPDAPGAPIDDVETALPRPAAPAQTQSHGTVLVGVVCGFVLLAVLLRLSIRGVGPFDVELVESRSSGDTLQVTLDITNTGERAGRANCRIPLEDSENVVQPPKTVVTKRIDPGETTREVITVSVANGIRPSGDISC